MVLGKGGPVAKVEYGINPAGLGPPAASYSHAARHGDFIFISPQQSRDASGNIMGAGKAEAQATRVYERLGELLQGLGGDLSSLLYVVIYVVGRESLDGLHRAQAALEKSEGVSRWPATTLVLCDELTDPQALIEIEGVAVVGESARNVQYYDAAQIEALATRRSEAARCGNLVWVSAQQAHTDAGKIIGPEDPAMQIRQVYRRVEWLLQALGGDLNSMVRTVTFVVGRESMSARDAYRREVSDAGLQKNMPASTSGLVAGLEDPEALVQMEAVAVIGVGPGGIRPQYSINPAGMSRPNMVLSHAVRYGNWAWIAGQWCGNVGVGDSEQETRAVYANTEAVLNELGGDLNSFVKQTTYVTYGKNVADSNKVRDELLKAGKIKTSPAGIVFIVGGVGPPQALVEIDGVVVVD